MRSPLRTAGIVTGFLIGGLFVYLSLRALDWETVSQTLSRVEPIWAVLALPALAAAFALRCG